MTKKAIDPFDEFYCMSSHDPHMAFTTREIYKLPAADKTCVSRKALHKFGENTSVGTSLVPINSWGEFEDYQTSNITLNMSSSSASDTGEVTIEYMYFDGNNDLQFGIQTQTLQGQTPVALPTAACRWMRMTTELNNAGDVYIYRGTATSGVPDTLSNTHCQIPAGNSQSQKAATSVASSNYFVLTYLWADILKKSNASAEIFLRIRTIGQDFRIRLKRGTDSSHALSYNFLPYEIIGPNSDIEILAGALSGSDNNVSAGFDGYFADIIS